MQYATASLGRVFIIRLEHGDVLHESIEKMARDQSIRAAALVVLGGADKGSRLVVGPADGRARPQKVQENPWKVQGRWAMLRGT